MTLFPQKKNWYNTESGDPLSLFDCLPLAIMPSFYEIIYIYMMTYQIRLIVQYINGQVATLTDFISPAFIRTQMARRIKVCTEFNLIWPMPN